MRQHHSTLYFTDLNHLISTTPLWINDQLTLSQGCYKVSWLGSGFYTQRVAPTTCFKPSFFSPIACITNLVLVKLQHFKSCYGLQRRKHICKILWRMALDCGNALGGMNCNITLDIDPTKMSNNEFAGEMENKQLSQTKPLRLAGNHQPTSVYIYIGVYTYIYICIHILFFSLPRTDHVCSALPSARQGPTIRNEGLIIQSNPPW